MYVCANCKTKYQAIYNIKPQDSSAVSMMSIKRIISELQIV